MAYVAKRFLCENLVVQLVNEAISDEINNEEEVVYTVQIDSIEKTDMKQWHFTWDI